MRVRSFVPWLLVLTTSLGGVGIGPVLAQAIKEPGWPPPEGAACKPSKADDEEAQTLFKLAVKAEDTSNYTDAIKYYKDAYKRACNRPLLLKNLGRAYEKDAQYAAAVEAYKLYRARGKPTGDELDQLDQKIANLSKKVPGEPTSPAGTDTAPTTTATGTGTAVTTATAEPTATATAAPTTTAAPGGGPGIAPWIVVGAGGALLVVGGIVGLGANKTVSEKQDAFNNAGCNTSVRNRDLCLSLKDDGEAAASTRTVGWVVAGVGAAAVVGGLVWYFTGQKKAEHKTGLQITPGPTFAGLGIAGAF
ncbi:MAG: tetratricopeptide repeat protein [Deltaproteobacteria bacterium]|nr:tetratricopeptide repeat protein [Deltaproteobacteria bacterium]